LAWIRALGFLRRVAGPRAEGHNDGKSRSWTQPVACLAYRTVGTEGNMVRKVRCPVATSLDLVGDRWTLLVVRDLLRGHSRFSDLRNTVEGIPGSVLSDRLRTL